jgi:hypothetical protein
LGERLDRTQEVGGSSPPSSTVEEALHRHAQRGQVAARLLDRADVKARDDLGDRAQVGEIALRRILGTRPPRVGEAAEGADVPCAEQQMISVAGGQLRVEVAV